MDKQATKAGVVLHLPQSHSWDEAKGPTQFKIQNSKFKIQTESLHQSECLCVRVKSAGKGNAEECCAAVVLGCLDL